MIVTTIRDLLTGKFRVLIEEQGFVSCDVIRDADFLGPEWFADHTLYAFQDREEEKVLYVGQSKKDVLKRVSTYIGPNRYDQPSPLRRLIQANMPKSYDWEIALLTTGDCIRMLPTPRSSSPSWILSINQAEQRLIHHYQPCLNIAHNDKPTPLPGSYHLPASEVPDGLVCTMDTPRNQYEVSYTTYDFIQQKNRTYKVTMYARYKQECRQLIMHLLKHTPGGLSLRLIDPQEEAKLREIAQEIAQGRGF